MDYGAHLVIIGKRFAQELRFTACSLALCPFIIVTSIGHVERAIGYLGSHYSVASELSLKIHLHLFYLDMR